MMSEHAGNSNLEIDEVKLVAQLLAISTTLAAFGPTLISRLLDMSDVEQASLRIDGLYGFYVFGALFCGGLIALTSCRQVLRGLGGQWILLAALSAFALSVAAGGFQLRPMMVLAIGWSILIFYYMGAAKITFNPEPVAWILCTLAALPVVLFFVGKIDMSFWVSESFRGFGDSRTDYAYFAGLAAVMGFSLRRPLLWCVSIPSLVGLAAAGSRAALVSLICSAVVVACAAVWRRDVLRTAIIIGACMFTIALPFTNIIEVGRQITFGTTVDDGSAVQQIGVLADYNGRMNIYEGALLTIRSTWLFGAGDFFQNSQQGGGLAIEAHNSILQSVMNFGVIVTALWLALLAVLFFQTSVVGRAVLTFWFVYGMFQPGADAFLFVPESLLVLLIAAGARAPAGERLMRT